MLYLFSFSGEYGSGAGKGGVGDGGGVASFMLLVFLLLEITWESD